MLRTELLLQRLDEIGGTLGRKGGALLLLGVGSVGVELERMDEYSDLKLTANTRCLRSES